jgi:hypothetical protein
MVQGTLISTLLLITSKVEKYFKYDLETFST